MNAESLGFYCDSFSDLLRFRRRNLGLTQREVEERTALYGPREVNRGAYGRAEGGYWIPRDIGVLQAIARALELPDSVVIEFAKRTLEGPKLLKTVHSGTGVDSCDDLCDG